MKHKLIRLTGILTGFALGILLMFSLDQPVQADSLYGSLVVTSTDTEETLPAKVVHFNGCDWYILADESEAARPAVLLFAKDVMYSCKYDSNGTNSFRSSTVLGVLNKWTASTGSFGTVSAAILGNSIDLATDVKLFLLSKDEVEKIYGLPVDVKKCSADWWLIDTTKGPGYDRIGEMVKSSGDGLVDPKPYVNAEAGGGVRPACRLNLKKVDFDPNTNTFVPRYNISITGGRNCTISPADGISQQTHGDAMTTVTYTAEEGSFFRDFYDITVNGVTVHRESDTVVTVSGTPRDDTDISVPLAVGNQLQALIPQGQEGKEELKSMQVEFLGMSWIIIEDNSISDSEGYITLLDVGLNWGARTYYGITNFKYSESLPCGIFKNSFDHPDSRIKKYEYAIKTVYLSDDNIEGTVSEDTPGAYPVKLYLLSKTEAEALPENLRKLDTSSCTYIIPSALRSDPYYWLRTFGSGAETVYAMRCTDGKVYPNTESAGNNELFLVPQCQIDLSKVVFDADTMTFTPSLSVTIQGGAHATVSGGETKQIHLLGEMDTVTYTADKGYTFPATSDYYGETNGVTVTRVSDTVVTVSGTPDPEADVTVPDAEALPACTVTTAPEARSLVYDSQAQALVTEGTASGGTMQYALGTDAYTAPTSGWSASVPAETEAGTYYVWYQVKGDDKHSDSAVMGPVTVTISRAGLSDGLHKEADGSYLLYLGGKVATDYTDLYEDKDLGWWLVSGGKVAFGYTDLFCSDNYGWWLIVDGRVAFEYNDLFGSDNFGWWKINGGQVDFGYSDLYDSSIYGMWLIEGGSVNFGYTARYDSARYGSYNVEGGFAVSKAEDKEIIPDGLRQDADGVWRLYLNGAAASDYSDLYYDANLGWWLVTNGVVNFGFDDIFCSPNLGWWKITGGSVDFGYTELFCSPVYGWWKLAGGQVDFGYTDIYDSATFGKWLINGGSVAFDYTGEYVSANYGKWAIEGGQAVREIKDDAPAIADGLSPASDGNWYLYQNGSVATGYNDLYYDANYGWWLVANGRVCFEYNDLYCSPSLGWWKIKDGSVDFGYTDLYCSPSYGWWKIVGGQVDFGFSDLYCSPSYGWWLVTGGQVDFGFTELYCSQTYGWWLINGGQVDFGYNGVFNSPTYGTWNIGGGQVIF